MNELPTGTVTLLLADVEGSTRLWETQPKQMPAVIARLDQVLSAAIGVHHGVRPVEQGEGDSFVIAFSRASDALACALELQRAPLTPIRLRIGIHTGEVQLRDEANYIGPAINRTARLRDLAHGGQTVISGATEPLVVDALPDDVSLIELGTHALRDLPRPERVVQMCHPDLQKDFPPLRTAKPTVSQHLPPQPTSFVGRQGEIDEVRQALEGNRLVTLTGAGGVGKTRLSVEIAAQLTDQYADGVWYADLAQITDPDGVSMGVMRAFGLPDRPGSSRTDVLLNFIGERRMLVVLDNCEHLLDPCATLVAAILSACPHIALLATSREPIRVAGEHIWQVPSMSLVDEAIELFTERAQHVRPNFQICDDTTDTVAEICVRLDGMPLAIELAAARVRALSLAEILEGLNDRFRLLTGGARTAVRRQQTLRASVEWSHALLTEPERVLFRRLAMFLGGFSLDAAQAVAGGAEVERYQILDQLTLLVDKSLVVAENATGRTRYRMLETVRQYALEKLGESGEADTVRNCHRDYYTAMATLFDKPDGVGRRVSVRQAEAEIANLRAAFAWSRESSDYELALALASSLRPLWITRGRLQEGLAWLDAALADVDAQRVDVAPAVRARALADKAILAAAMGVGMTEEADQALEIAREVDDAALLVHALTASGAVRVFNLGNGNPFFTEAMDHAEALGDRWTLSQIMAWQALSAFVLGDPVAARAAGEKGHVVAEAIGDRFVSLECRWLIACSLMWQGDLAEAIARFEEVAAEAHATRNVVWMLGGVHDRVHALAYHGDTAAAIAAAAQSTSTAVEIAGWYGYNVDWHNAPLVAALAAGEVPAADGRPVQGHPLRGALSDANSAINNNFLAEAAWARGDFVDARQWADWAVSASMGFHRVLALKTRARIGLMQNVADQGERDACDALTLGAELKAYLPVPDLLECLAEVAHRAAGYPRAARLLGAAHAARQRMGVVRFKIYDDHHHALIGSLRAAMGSAEFDDAWARGAAMSTDEGIAYAQRVCAASAKRSARVTQI